MMDSRAIRLGFRKRDKNPSRTGFVSVKDKGFGQSQISCQPTFSNSITPFLAYLVVDLNVIGCVIDVCCCFHGRY
jgi:hypothetical protein